MMSLAFFALVITVTIQSTVGQNVCGMPLSDIPNPASDSCTAFFRCYRFRQYSVRCPAGQAFDFDKSRCRASNFVDCPLQLQRFQAPGVPAYLRPNQAQDGDSGVEIRVVHVGANTDANNLQVTDANGQPIAVTRQFVNGQQAQQGQSQIRSPPINPYLSRPIHQSPVGPRNQFVNNAAPVQRQGVNQGQIPAQASQTQGQGQGGQLPAQGQTNPNPSFSLSLGQ